MKKLLGILVLGLLWCNTAFADQEVRNASQMWKNYKNLNAPYKIFLDIIDWKAQRFNHGNTVGYSNVSLRQALDTVHYHDVCKRGCIVTHIGMEKISLERQKRIAKEYLPPSIYDKYFSKIEEPKQQQSPDDNKVVAASMGSGFFVTRAGHLVTNYHVIEGCNAVKANILGKEIQADIIAVDKTNDLAIIKAKTNPSKVFPVSNEDVVLLQDVIVAGFPLGKKVSSAIKIHKGSVTALAGFGDNYSNFQTDATINQGNSGGPIMNLKGNVVGVAVQLIAAEHAQNVFFGVKSSTLKTFAKANNIKFLPPNYREMSNEDLGKLITEATVFLDCWMTVAKIKRIIAQEENRKAFYSEHR